jgi:hypothetical protein
MTAGRTIPVLIITVALTLGAPARVWAVASDPGVGAGGGHVAGGQEAPALTLPPPAAPAADVPAGLSDATKQGIGCLATSGATVAYATFWAGATESLMVASGGMLVPSMAPTLWLGLVSTVVAATCALGATATPFVLWTIEQKDNIVANIEWQVRQTGTELVGLFTTSAPSGSGQLAGRAP